MLEEIKKAASDEIKSEIQRLLETAERDIRKWKERVSNEQREAESAEGQLGLLKKEGEYEVNDSNKYSTSQKKVTVSVSCLAVPCPCPCRFCSVPCPCVHPAGLL